MKTGIDFDGGDLKMNSKILIVVGLGFLFLLFCFAAIEAGVILNIISLDEQQSQVITPVIGTLVIFLFVILFTIKQKDWFKKASKEDIELNQTLVFGVTIFTWFGLAQFVFIACRESFIAWDKTHSFSQALRPLVFFGFFIVLLLLVAIKLTKTTEFKGALERIRKR